PGPSATLSSSTAFPGTPVIRPTLLRRFRNGTRGLLQLPDVSCVPCRRSHPAGGAPPRQPDCDGPSCLRAINTRSASGPFSRGYPCVHSRYGPATRSHPSDGSVDGLQSFGLPPPCHPSYGGSGSYPGGTYLPLNTSAFSGRTFMRDSIICPQ